MPHNLAEDMAKHAKQGRLCKRDKEKRIGDSSVKSRPDANADVNLGIYAHAKGMIMLVLGSAAEGCPCLNHLFMSHEPRQQRYTTSQLRSEAMVWHTASAGPDITR